MAQWNIRFNDELIGPFDDAETQAISQKLTTSTRTQGGVVFSGKLADSGNDVMPHQLRTDLRTGRDHTPALAPQGLPYIHSFRTSFGERRDDVLGGERGIGVVGVERVGECFEWVAA